MRNDYQKELEHLHDQVRQLSKDPAYKVPEVPPRRECFREGTTYLHFSGCTSMFVQSRFSPRNTDNTTGAAKKKACQAVLVPRHPARTAAGPRSRP